MYNSNSAPCINMTTFIGYIKERRIFWDASLPEYSCKQKKENAWWELTKIITPGFEELSPMEQHDTMNMYKRKWKSLRNCYTRECSLQRKPTKRKKGMKRRQYIYFDELEFLKPYTKSSSTAEDNFVDDEEEPPTYINPADDGEEEDEDEEDDPPPIEMDFEANTSDAASKNIKKEPSMDEMANRRRHKKKKNISVLNTFSLNTNYEMYRTTYQEDKLFLLSLVSDLNAVPPAYKLDVKSELLSVFKKAKMKYGVDPLQPSSSTQVLSYPHKQEVLSDQDYANNTSFQFSNSSVESD